jgi:NAD(P)-dependent dehydrogenase (short-subunit alcohol dehydrogenase family)
VALITGAGSGIGRAMADSFAMAGCKLVLVDIDPLSLEEVSDELATQSPVLPMVGDVTEPSQVEQFCETAVCEFGGVDILVNNAGMAMGGFINTVPLAHWKKLMDLNFWGYVYTTQALLPHMLGRGSGHLVFISSISGVATSPNSLPYSTSKFAVVALAESVAAHVRPRGIGVTLVCPGTTKTGIAENGRFFFDSIDARAAKSKFQSSIDKGIPAEVVAGKIVKAIREDRYLVVTHWFIRFLTLFRALSPETYLRFSSWYHQKELDEAQAIFSHPAQKESA